MAMNKKEKAELQAAIDRADLNIALRWTEPVERDVPPPPRSDIGARYTSGWDYNAYSNRVYRGWSDSVAHGDGDPPTPQTRYKSSASQGARPYYSTELLALKAMRHEVERDAATKLMRIDRMIAAAVAGGVEKP